MQIINENTGYIELCESKAHNVWVDGYIVIGSYTLIFRTNEKDESPKKWVNRKGFQIYSLCFENECKSFLLHNIPAHAVAIQKKQIQHNILAIMFCTYYNSYRFSNAVSKWETRLVLQKLSYNIIYMVNIILCPMVKLLVWEHSIIL